MLKALLKYALQLGLVRSNIAAEIGKIYKGGRREEIIWTDDDMLRFHAAAIKHGMEPVWDALGLAAATGLRREDLVTLDGSQASQFAIVK